MIPKFKILLPGNKLMSNIGQINVKLGLNSAAKPWIQFDYNITFEINGKIIDVYYYLFIYCLHLSIENEIGDI